MVKEIILIYEDDSKYLLKLNNYNVDPLFSLSKEVYLTNINSEGRYITMNTRYRVMKRQHYRCNICHIKLKIKENSQFGDVIAHINHIHPYSERKTYFNGEENINEERNLQALCPKCNLSKKDNEVN